jgi:hypothetical protein
MCLTAWLAVSEVAVVICVLPAALDTVLGTVAADGAGIGSCDVAACNVGRGGSGGGSGGAWARGGRDGVVSHFFCAVDGCSPTVLVGSTGMIDGDVAVDVGFPGGSTGAWGVAGARGDAWVSLPCFIRVVDSHSETL